MNNPKISYALIVNDAADRDQLAVWAADSPFGSVMVGDTLDPSGWERPLYDCVFRVEAIEHEIGRNEGTEGSETLHTIYLSCAKESITNAVAERL